MEGYPFSVPVAVRWRDLDPLGHVNNAVYVTYLEVARTALWRERLGGRDARDIPFVVARVEIDYRREVGMGARVEVGVRTERIGRTSFTLAYRIEADGETAAEARSVQVCVGRDGRPVPVPAELRAALAGLAG
ncbi:MAG: acyl-CoA thioesterase [Nitrospirae bacterium]|nr:MAG: acyl-CoA thioesterase [Nitrospirota bacterium]